ncbi:acyltransferase [Mangrovibacterium marinum]|nr:acyltransferase [Mangrovibacterium marinum]
MKSEHFIHPSACVDDGAQIGADTKIWHFCHLMGGARVGNNCILGQNVFVGGEAQIGNGVKIQNNVSIYDSVVLEDDVFCGPGCVFTNVKNPRAFIERKSEFSTTTVRRGATIGANATIVCGLTIGAYALIGAGAVVTKNVKAHALMTGNPATQTGWVSRAGLRLNKSLCCPETGEQYQLVNGELVLKA